MSIKAERNEVVHRAIKSATINAMDLDDNDGNEKLN